MRQDVEVTVQPKNDGVHHGFPFSSKPQRSQLFVVNWQALEDTASRFGCASSASAKGAANIIARRKTVTRMAAA